MRSRNVTIWVTVVILCLASSQAMAWTQFKDGQIHNIDYQIDDDVWVDWEAPGMETTVNLLDGGGISNNLQGFEDSSINILGGSTYNLWAYNSSEVTMSGGSIGKRLWAYDSSQVTMSGGSIGGDLWAYNSSQVNISGGSISWLYPYESSQVTMSGGSVGYLETYGSSQVTLSGGEIGGGLWLGDSATLTIHGLDFAIDGQPFGYGELTSIRGGDYGSEPYRHLTGMLASGDPLSNDFRIGQNAKIILVPEPATLLLLGLGAMILRKRRGE